MGLLLLIGFFGLLWWLFTRWNPEIEKDITAELSVETEEKLGDLVVESIMENPTISLIENDTLDSMLQIIEYRLLKNIGLTDYDYHFYVIDNPVVNAFAVPGGHIFIYSGLIKFTDRPEELASVIAHEVGHIENRHTVEKLIREFSLSILITIITGNDAVMISDISRSVIASTFNRKAESEADEYGLHLMERSSINPRHMATLFRKMNDEKYTYDEDLEIMMSHPHNNSRIKAALEYETRDDFQEEEFRMDWSLARSLASN